MTTHFLAEFSLSAVQDITKKYLDPEPYQAQPSDRPQGTLWQNLAQGSTARSGLAYTTSTRSPSPQSTAASAWRGQDSSPTARVDVAAGRDTGPTNANGWTLPRYPTQDNYGQARNNMIYNPPNYANMASERSPLVVSQPPTLSGGGGLYETGYNMRPLSGGFNTENPASSFNRLEPVFDNSLQNLQNAFPSSERTDKLETRMSASSDSLMSPYMEAPPPPSPAAGQDNSAFAEDNTIANDLERLFNQRKMDIFNSDSFRPLSSASDSPPLRPQTFGNVPNVRRNDNSLAVNSAGSVGGFWNRMPQQTTSTEADLLRQEIDRIIAIESSKNNFKVYSKMK